MTPESLDDVVDLGNINSHRGTLVGQFDIEMTLTRRVPPAIQEELHQYNLLNEQVLTSAAFVPKNYKVRLERGRFDDPSSRDWPLWTNYRTPFFHRARKFEFRLVYDKSPFPPLDEWKEEGKGAAKGCKFTQMKEFADREVSKDNWLVFLFRKVTHILEAKC